jgi:hypothetical protein
VAPLFRAHPQHTASPDLAQQVREQVVRALEAEGCTVLNAQIARCGVQVEEPGDDRCLA